MKPDSLAWVERGRGGLPAAYAPPGGSPLGPYCPDPLLYRPRRDGRTFDFRAAALALGGFHRARRWTCWTLPGGRAWALLPPEYRAPRGWTGACPYNFRGGGHAAAAGHAVLPGVRPGEVLAVYARAGALPGLLLRPVPLAGLPHAAGGPAEFLERWNAAAPRRVAAYRASLAPAKGGPPCPPL